MTNMKNHKVYTDKLQLSVIELKNIDLATEEDRRFQVDRWAKLFKAKTWEELKAMAVTNQYMESAVNTMYELSTDERVQEQCRRRAEYEYFQKQHEEKILALNKTVADQQAEITELKRLLAENNKIHHNQK